MIKRLSTLLLLLVGGVFLASQAQAAILEGAYVQLNNPRGSGTSSHTFVFTAANPNLGSVYFTYCVLPSGACDDTGADGSGFAIGQVLLSGGNSDTWTASWNGGSYRIEATKDEAETNAANEWTFPFTSMTNPTQANCTNNSPSNYSTATCYVRIQTYTGTDFSGAADNAVVSITVTQAVTITARVNPTFAFRVDGINGGVSKNGTALSSGISTSVTTIPFGNLTAGNAYFAGHLLTLTGNNQGGFIVTAKMDANMTGTAYGHSINAFAGISDGADTDTTTSWESPDGTVSGTNTGFLGVGTDDTGVTNRNNNQFFTLNTTGTVVARTTGPASSRQSNVVYGIEANAYMQADNYTGVMTFNALPTY